MTERKKKTVSLYLDKDFVEILDKIAEKEKRSLTKQIEWMLVDTVKRRKK